MKLLIASLLAASALMFSAQAADVTAKISNVHLCCDSCVKGVTKAVTPVTGVTAVSDKDSGTVTLTGPDQATVQKAADALVAAGYFGVSTDVKLDGTTGVKDAKTQSLTINGLHLCCAKCVKAVDKACKSVPGVTAQTAVKGASSFEVTGDFNGKDVFDALQKAGLTGKAGN